MADAVPAGPSPFAGQACPERGESARQAHTSTSHKPRPQKRSRESENEQPAQPAAAAPTPAVAQPGPEAKRSTVDAALSVFRREFPDFTEDDSREALSSCYRTDNTIQMLIEAAFEHLVAKLTGAPAEEVQQPEEQQIVQNVAAPAGAPNDEEEAFEQETEQMRQAMHMSEVENAAHKKQQEKPMHQWCSKDFQEHFPHSIILPEIAKQCRQGCGIARMCTTESSCEVDKLLKNEKRCQQWYKTERGMHGYWMKYADLIVQVCRGFMAASTSKQPSLKADIPASAQKPHRKRKLRSIDADPASKTTLLSSAASSPDSKKLNSSQPPHKLAGLHIRSRSVTPAPAATVTGATGGAPVATPSASQGGATTSKTGGVCASPTESDCSALRRSRRIQSRADSVAPSREGSVEPRGAGFPAGAGAAGQENTAAGPSHTAGDSAVAGAPQCTAAGNAAGSMRMQEQPGGAGVLYTKLLQQALQGGVAAGCDRDSCKENGGKQQDAAAGIDECDRERGGEKAKEASAETGVQASEQKGQQDENGREKAQCSTDIVGEKPSDGVGTQEKVKTEEEVIAVLTELNRKFEEEVIAVAASPANFAAFVPFRPAETSKREEDGECVVSVCQGMTERRSKEGAIQIEID